MHRIVVLFPHPLGLWSNRALKIGVHRAGVIPLPLPLAVIELYKSVQGYGILRNLRHAVEASINVCIPKTVQPTSDQTIIYYIAVDPLLLGVVCCD